MTCKECIHEKVCDALIKSGCPYLDKEIPAEAFCLEFRNTADVVPKSEVERLEHLRAELSKEIETLKDNNEHLAVLLAEAKSEVARDIIYDIEMYVLGIKSGKEIVEKTTPKIYRLKRKDYMEAVLEYLAELKKKYTEGENGTK